MTNKNNIPTEVIKIQKENGFNHSELIAKTKDGDIYSFSRLDDNGFEMPTGLPMLVIVKDGKTEIVSGMAAFKLSDKLFPEE